jgi:hypothetical protein
MSLLLKLIIATPEGVGILEPPMAMMAGNGAVPDGKDTEAVKEMLLPS